MRLFFANTVLFNRKKVCKCRSLAWIFKLLYNCKNMKNSVETKKIAVDKMSFEQAVAELEDLLTKMERNTLSLDDSLAAYQRGSALVKHCQTQLARVEQQVMLLDESSGNLQLLTETKPPAASSDVTDQ